MGKLVALGVLALAGWLWFRRYLQPAVPMDIAEASAILGLAPDAPREEVRAAHRRLVGAVHPDKGGSAELTRRINAARDVLMKRPD